MELLEALQICHSAQSGAWICVNDFCYFYKSNLVTVSSALPRIDDHVFFHLFWGFRLALYIFISEVRGRFAALHLAQQRVCCYSNCGAARSSAACLCNGYRLWQRPIISSRPLCASSAKMEGWASNVMHPPAIGHAGRQSAPARPLIGGGAALPII